MSTHDFILDNASGLAFRTDLNNALSAIVTNNSNATEPTTTYAYMWWADTTSDMLKLRNSSDTAWLDILTLSTGVQLISINDLTDAFTDINNIALGSGALQFNAGGFSNTALGIISLYSNTTGYRNTAIGDGTLYNNTTGYENTAIGYQALTVNTTGYENTAIGVATLQVNTTGYENTAIGFAAAIANTTGYMNTALGYAALYSNTTGVINTAIGHTALYSNTTGADNTGVGTGALFTNTTGNNNIAIGAGAHGDADGISDAITMGHLLEPVGANYITMGNPAAYIYNQYTANAAWTHSSDERIKKDIKTNNDCGLDFVNDLRTVTYKFRAPSELGKEMSNYNKDIDTPSYNKPMYGFIAQEVKEALDKHNITDFAGHHQKNDDKDNLQGISYEMFVIPLVNSVQELTRENQELSGKMTDMELTISILMSRLDTLEDNQHDK